MSLVPKAVLAKCERIAMSSTEEFRNRLNKNIHLVDISFRALRSSDPKLTEEDYALLIQEFQISFHGNTYSSLNTAIKQIKLTSVGRVSLVIDREFGIYVLGPSYTSVQKRISKIISYVTHIQSEFTGKDETGTTVANIGHMPNTKTTGGRSPLEEKLIKLFNSVPLSSVAAEVIGNQISELYTIHEFGFEYAFTRPSFNTAKFNNILGGIVVIVTLQSKTLNNELSKYEKDISNRIAEYVGSKQFANDLIVTPGSNTILKDVELTVLASITSKHSTSRHTKKPSTKSKIDTKAPKVTAGATTGKISQLRAVSGQFYSLNLLQNLINSSLQDVISANMGKGTSRNILNFQTGRFAASAQVERMSQSREGMITAFYSYMKNPYQTFEPGFAQGSPKTRDPKLLISQSIRDIAATKVGNRLRAVSV